MIFAVLLKGAPDLSALSVSSSQNKIFEKAARQLDPVSEEALELALRAREARAGEKPALAAYLIGRPQDEPLLRSALARGAERAVFLSREDADALDPHQKAALLQNALAQEHDLAGVFAGARSPAGGSGETGGRLGARLRLPIFVVDRPEALQTVTWPACVVVAGGTVKLRLANAIQLMKAGQKPIEQAAAGGTEAAWKVLAREEVAA